MKPTPRTLTTGALTYLCLAMVALGHDDDPKASVEHPAVKGKPFRAALEEDSVAAARAVGFPSDGVQLMSWLPLNTFPGNPPFHPRV